MFLISFGLLLNLLSFLYLPISFSFFLPHHASQRKERNICAINQFHCPVDWHWTISKYLVQLTSYYFLQGLDSKLIKQFYFFIFLGGFEMFMYYMFARVRGCYIRALLLSAFSENEQMQWQCNRMKNVPHNTVLCAVLFCTVLFITAFYIYINYPFY